MGWAASYLFRLGKVAIHIKINSLVGNSFIDTFFKYYTNVGDGVFAVVLGLIILFINIRNGIYVLATYILSGLTTSAIKNYFYDNNRPHFVFGYFVDNYKLKLVEGVDMMALNSFPSGHSTSAFALFTSLALLTGNQFVKVLFFMIAFMAAFSRTYLSQHWLVDITVGSLIGVITAIVLYFVFIHNDKLKKLDRPLFNFKKS